VFRHKRARNCGATWRFLNRRVFLLRVPVAIYPRDLPAAIQNRDLEIIIAARSAVLLGVFGGVKQLDTFDYDAHFLLK